MCAIYLVLLYCMERMGLLFVLGVLSLSSSSFCVVYFSVLLNAVIMLSCVYPRWISATRKCWSFSMPWVQIANMSSMNLIHSIGMRLLGAF